MFVGIDVYIWMATLRKERKKGAGKTERRREENEEQRKNEERERGRDRRRERGRKRRKEEGKKGEGKGCLSLLSAAVINTTITVSLRRKVFISFYSLSWREAKARLQAGTWRQEQRGNQRGLLLTNSLGLLSYTIQDHLPRSSTDHGALSLLTSIIHQENASHACLQASVMEVTLQLRFLFPR